MNEPALAPAPWYRPWLWLFGWVFLTLYFLAPPREAMTPDLDPSNHGTYAWMFTHHVRYGVDVVPMAGPFGFVLYGTTYSGDLWSARFALDLILKATFAWLVLWMAAQLGRDWRRVLWIAALVVFLPNVDDTLYDATLFLGGLALMLAGDGRPRLSQAVIITLLGFLSLTKGNQLTLSGLTIGAVVLHHLLHRRTTWLWFAPLLWIGTILAAWTAAGQRVSDLPAFARGVSALTSGYNETMGLNESRDIFLVGIALVGGLFTTLALLAGRARSWRLLACFAFVAGFIFVKWKHGYVRADGHVQLLFNFALVLLPTLWLCAEHWRPVVNGISHARGWRITLAVTGIASFLVAFAGASDFWLLRSWAMLRDLPTHVRVNWAYVTRPAEFRHGLDLQLKQERIAADLPQIRNEVGRGTVDFFGFEQGVLLLNELNYHPRPMGGGTFNVFNRTLQQLNERFLLDPARRPQFQVMKFRSLDERWPAMNDGPTFNALLHLYTPVLIQRDFMLLRARRDTVAPRPQKLAEQPVRPGEAITLPAVPPGHMLLFSLRAPPSARGWLRRTLYRAPLLQAEITTEHRGWPRRFRLEPAMLKEPAILSPFLENNFDVVSLYGTDNGDLVRTLRIVTESPECFDLGLMRIVFYTLPRPPAPEDADVTEIVTYMKHPLHNRAALRLQTEQTGIRELNKEPITLVHAPGVLEFPVGPADQQVIFSYGLMPQAYDPGTTDGVEFFVELVSPHGEVATLFRRLLQPLAFPEHRGMQRARVFFPPRIAAGSTLRLRTDPGPAGNGAWDQSYITRLQIKEGGSDPRRYIGFNVAPEEAVWNANNEYALDGHPVRSVHPPFRARFALPAGARHVVLGFGLMPGAYTGEGASDGVGFELHALAPDGTRRLLWQRMLDPRRAAGDRGIIGADVPLPALPVGTRLEFSTNGGPHGDQAWDWAVLQTLYIE